MAKLVSKITLGIDIAKDKHALCNWNTQEIIEISNQRDKIRELLRSFHGQVRIALEPTSTYHFILVEEALALGHEVYLINPRQLVHYREAVNVRNKTDPDDAWLLARYLEHEASQLRPFQPQDRRAQRMWALILRRGTVVQSRQKLQQSFREVQMSIRALITQLNQVLARIDQHIQQLIRELGWWCDYQHCLSIPGIGPGNAAALVAAFHRGAFSGSDAFVAFLGLDVRIRESGRYKGRRKLTKRGEAELRRLLYCASHAARNYPPFAAFYQKQIDKGMPKIAARVTLARKLIRIAFSLMKNQQTFIKKEKTYCMAP